MRRSWSVLVALALFTGVLLAQPGSAAPAQAAASSRLTATPARPMLGEAFSVTGKLSSKVVRPVALQRKVGKKWRNVAASVTAADGRFTFRTSTTSSVVNLRVVAKKVRVGRKTYKKISSPIRKVSTAAQTASLSMPAGAFVNQAITASVSLSPARAGRPLRLEVLTAAVWVHVADGFELTTGRSDIALTAKMVGRFSYRAVAPAWNGAAAVTSAVSTVTITPDQVTVNPEARDLTAAEESHIAGYDAATGTVTVASAPSSMASITKDNLLTLAPRAEAPSGALRKVTGVTRAGSTTTITTAEASLPR